MHERPIDFPDSLIASVIKKNYDLTVTGITFLDLGADAWAWTYRWQSTTSPSSPCKY